MIKEFKDFALRGNLLELAVAFVMGIAFAAVVSALVDGVIVQLIAAIIGEPNFGELTFKVRDSVILYGYFLTELTTFLLIALVLFWVVKAANRVMPQKATKRDCPHCLTSIPIAATACAACGRDVPS